MFSRRTSHFGRRAKQRSRTSARRTALAPQTSVTPRTSLPPRTTSTHAIRTALLSPVLLLALALVPAPPLPAQTVAITGGTVIVGDDTPPIPNGVVLFANGRITAAGAAPATPVPASATIIDASGKFVIPGLIDGNLHLFLNLDLETLILHERRLHEIVLEAAQITLRTGQTTVFDTWGPRAALVQARNMIDAGDAPGSRIFLAGNIIGFSGPLGPDFRESYAAHVSQAFVKRINDAWEEGTGRELLWYAPDSVATIIRNYTSLGMDFLKYGASGHVDMNLISFSERVQRVIVDEGHRAGMTVQTHTTSVESFDMAIEAGVDIITHCGISGPVVPLPMESIRKMVDRGVACSVLPITARRLDALETHNPGGTLTPYMQIGAINRRNLIEAGAKLLMSTDAGIENPVLRAESATLASDTIDPRVKLGEGHFNALVALEELGMAPLEVLRSATSNVAEAYRLDDTIGTLRPGRWADIVILDADPLADARNYRRIHMVIKEGNTVDREALPVAPLISSLR